MKRIAQKRGKDEFQGKRCYVGVDVHKLTYYAALLSEEGFRLEFSSPADPVAFLKQIQDMGVNILRLAYESGPTGYELAWSCQESSIPVTVAASSKIPRKIMADGKTDRLDGMKLAEYLAKDMLKSIAIPTREEHGIREIERRRQQVVYSRTKLKQQIKCFLLKNKISEPEGLEHWSRLAVEKLKEVSAEKTNLQITLNSYLRQLEFFNQEVDEIKKTLAASLIQQGKGELVNNLKTIPGVGETVSRTFAAEIFRPERFDRSEGICAYVGLAPITSQSGQGKAKARLHHVGQAYLRSTLVESAWILVRKEIYYRNIYNKILGRTNLPQKAIVAVARRLLVIMWRMAVENRAYQSNSSEQAD